MSNALAVVNETVPTTLTAPNQFATVTLTVTGGQIYTDPPYVPVEPNALAHITWTLDVEHSDEGVLFDNPAISFFGESPNVIWLAPAPNVRAALWLNDNPQRSYAYRIHLLQRSGSGTYTPITDDPIVHNDPPPDA
jgi:hypothetical protein